MARRKINPEIKQNVTALVESGQMTIPEASKEHGIHASTVRSWVARPSKEPQTVVRHVAPTARKIESNDAAAEIDILRSQLEAMVKVIAYFATRA